MWLFFWKIGGYSKEFWFFLIYFYEDIFKKYIVFGYLVNRIIFLNWRSRNFVFGFNDIFFEELFILYKL